MKHQLTNDFFILLVLIGMIILAWGCAQIVQPTGGPKDEQPPQLDSLESTPNFQTNFTKQDIRLVFDEWIQLKDVSDQIVVSPFMDGYETSLKKKTVIFEFGEEPLKENITYIINFGSAVVDFTEGNPVPDLRMVFSTGDYIDSLSFNGRVTDAFTGEAVAGAVIVVHENLTDTTIIKNKPLYISRTNETGNFSIQNMKADTFQVFALLENRSNYTYEVNTDELAFLDSSFILTDSSSLNINLRLSKAGKGEATILDKSLKEYGQVKFNFSNSPEAIELKAEPALPRFYSLAEKDSLLVWYHNPDTSAWSLILQQDTILNDTLKIKSGLDPADANLNLIALLSSEKDIIANPTQSLLIPFSQPIHRIDSGLINITLDSSTVALPIVRSRDADHRKLKLDYDWEPGKKYNLTIIPGGLESIHQRTNDTLRYNYVFQTSEDLSNLKLIISVPDSSQTYLLWLESAKEDKLKTETLSGQSQYTLDYKGLDPIEYNLRVIEETLVNGEWDGVDYGLRRQPERVALKKLGKLLANFDREEEWSITFKE